MGQPGLAGPPTRLRALFQQAQGCPPVTAGVPLQPQDKQPHPGLCLLCLSQPSKGGVCAGVCRGRPAAPSSQLYSEDAGGCGATVRLPLSCTRMHRTPRTAHSEAGTAVPAHTAHGGPPTPLPPSPCMTCGAQEGVSHAIRRAGPWGPGETVSRGSESLVSPEI